MGHPGQSCDKLIITLLVVDMGYIAFLVVLRVYIALLVGLGCRLAASAEPSSQGDIDG